MTSEKDEIREGRNKTCNTLRRGIIPYRIERGGDAETQRKLGRLGRKRVISRWLGGE